MYDTLKSLIDRISIKELYIIIGLLTPFLPFHAVIFFIGYHVTLGILYKLENRKG